MFLFALIKTMMQVESKRGYTGLHCTVHQVPTAPFVLSIFPRHVSNVLDSSVDLRFDSHEVKKENEI